MSVTHSVGLSYEDNSKRYDPYKDFFFYYFSYPKQCSLGLDPEKIKIERLCFKNGEEFRYSNPERFKSLYSCTLETIDSYSQIPSEELIKVPLFLLTPDNSSFLLQNPQKYDIRTWILKGLKTSFRMKIQYLGESVRYDKSSEQKKGWHVYEVPEWDTGNPVPSGRINANFKKIGNKGYLYGGYVPCELIEFYDKKGNFDPQFTLKPEFVPGNNIEVCTVNDLWEFDFVQETWELLAPLELRPINKFDLNGAPYRWLSSPVEDLIELDPEEKNQVYRKVTTARERNFVDYWKEPSTTSYSTENLYWTRLSATIQCSDRGGDRIAYVGYENISVLRHLTVSVYDCYKRTFTIFPTRFLDCTSDLLEAFLDFLNMILYLKFFGLVGIELFRLNLETGSIRNITQSFDWREGGKLIKVGSRKFLNIIIDEPEVAAKRYIFEHIFEGKLQPDKKKQSLHFQVLQYDSDTDNLDLCYEC